MSWCIPEIKALDRLGQEDLKSQDSLDHTLLKVSLGYMVRHHF